MRKKISGLSLIVLSILTACSQPITSLNTTPINNISSIKVKTSIIGKAEFPSSNKLSVKATLNDIGTNATISLIYPTEHPTLAHKTIDTGLTDTNGNFIINPDASFTPTLNELFVLEASKRTGSTGNAIMTVRTFIKWNGTTWNSITTPNIFINTKTTALSAMANLLSATMNSHDTIGTISVSGNVSTPSDVSHLGNVIIHANAINSVSNLVDFALSKNYDPFQYLTYQNGKFSLKDPSNIVNKITTVAGSLSDYTSPIIGNSVIWTGDGGQASSALLYGVSNIKFDNLGNMYIVERFRHGIRKVDKNTGIISTIAGTNMIVRDTAVNGFSGDGRQASNAQLNRPYSITFDSNNNLYITDSWNSRIRKIDKNTGIISTIAGNSTNLSMGIIYGSYGGDGGQSSNAQLNFPSGISFDSIGNMYIADAQNNRIRKIDTNGVISTFAGTGVAGFSGDGGHASNATLSYPNGVNFDTNGNMYIADLSNNRIRKIDTNGVISTFAGTGVAGFSGDGGHASNATLSYPNGVNFDTNGNMYIADLSNNRIRKIDTNGVISTFAGTGVAGFSGDGGHASNAQLNNPMEVTFDTNGNMYVADFQNNRIRKIDTNGVISTFAGTGVAGFSGDGGHASNATLSYPNGVNFDTNGNMYIADFFNHRVRKVSTNGIISTFAGAGVGDGEQATFAKLNNPLAVKFDNNNNMYIADSWNHKIRKVSTNGIITTFAGRSNSLNFSIGKINFFGAFSGDGAQATNSELNTPSDLALDNNGNMYIADTQNNRIRKVDTNGIITTFAGTGVAGFSGDGGQASLAQLKPSGVTVDNNGNMYIADTQNNRIRKVDTNGIITTFAGTGIAGSSGEGGQASLAQLNNPNKLIFDSNNNLYVSSDGGIKKVDVNGIITTLYATATRCITLDIMGNIYFSSNKLYKLDKNTNEITEIGGTNISSTLPFIGDGFIGDGGEASKALIAPSGIAFDSNGDLFISDPSSNRIRKVVLTPSVQP